MLDSLPREHVPQWLTDAAEAGSRAGFDLPSILKGSLYYPACGFDGTPIRHLAGNTHSFVYADYRTKQADFLDNLRAGGPDGLFADYEAVVMRELHRDDIVPYGWQPWMHPEAGRDTDRLPMHQGDAQPFGHWSVWRRRSGAPAADRPELLSFVYFAGEMSALYQGLYLRLAIAPRMLAIIAPGRIGGEWEEVESDDAFFRSVVYANPAGMPEYLVNGGYGSADRYAKPCWSDYGGDLLARLPERSAGVWRRNALRAPAPKAPEPVFRKPPYFPPRPVHVRPDFVPPAPFVRPPRTGPPGPAFTAPRSLQEDVSRGDGPVAETLALLALAESLAPGLTFRRTRRGGNLAVGDGWISFKWIASRRQLRVGLLGGVADYQCSSALPLRLSDATHVAFMFADAAELEAAKDYIRQAARRRAGDSAS
jgi:hypothetical protein